ncbi:hypothetical protein C8Q77DRAFT_837505 [Trametes polyzona]|nr:hypothetical protein C8Q77DRAFT_837505 [Trametes polyzona]
MDRQGERCAARTLGRWSGPAGTSLRLPRARPQICRDEHCIAEHEDQRASCLQRASYLHSQGGKYKRAQVPRHCQGLLVLRTAKQGNHGALSRTMKCSPIPAVYNGPSDHFEVYCASVRPRPRKHTSASLELVPKPRATWRGTVDTISSHTTPHSQPPVNRQWALRGAVFVDNCRTGTLRYQARWLATRMRPGSTCHACCLPVVLGTEWLRTTGLCMGRT